MPWCCSTLPRKGLGTIGQHLMAAGMSLTVVELDEGQPIPNALEEFDLMVVMGWGRWMYGRRICIRG